MPKEHPIQDGECLLSVADQHKVSKYKTIWDDGLNSQLKQDRPNPNMLVVGDVVKVPDPKEKTVQASAGSTAQITIKKPALFNLRLVLLGADDKPLKGKAWTLTAPVEASGTTGDNGLISVPALPVREKSGALSIVLRAPSAPAPAPAPAKAPEPSYPPAVVPDEFKDAAVPDPEKDLDTLELTLKIGSLPSHNHETGVKARLFNLGYLLDLQAKAEDVVDAVKRFQLGSLKQKDGSGKAQDIQDDLRKLHDAKP